MLLVAYASFSKNPGRQTVSAYVPQTHTILDRYQSDLNQDGLEDIILVLSRKDENAEGSGEEEGTRRRLIILMNKGDGYEKLVDSERIVYCKVCGGMMGDPYLGIKIKAPFFTVEHYGGGTERWQLYITFKYDRQRRNFFLHKLGMESFSAVDPGGTGKSVVETPKNFGLISIQNFDVYKQ